MKMEQSDKNINNNTSFKSHILLPVLFLLTLLVAILFVAIEDFIDGLEPFIIWFYFGIVMAYLAISIFDLITNKEKNKKLKTFVLVMIILTFVAEILYAIFFIIAKGR